MDTFKKNATEIRKAIKCNRKRIDREMGKSKFPHQIHDNYSDPHQKSKFDMNDKYYESHMKRDEEKS